MYREVRQEKVAHTGKERRMTMQMTKFLKVVTLTRRGIELK